MQGGNHRKSILGLCRTFVNAIDGSCFNFKLSYLNTLSSLLHVQTVRKSWINFDKKKKIKLWKQSYIDISGKGTPLITNVLLPKNHHPTVKEYGKKTLFAELLKKTFLFSFFRLILSLQSVALEASKQLWKPNRLWFLFSHPCRLSKLNLF